jgi:hypothetical protein
VRAVWTEEIRLAIGIHFRSLSTFFKDASVAQLVEHHLAKVNVEGSNPFARSIFLNYSPALTNPESCLNH